MNELDWSTCDLSGHLIAYGQKGTYWINEESRMYNLYRETGDAAGPNTEELGCHGSQDNAKRAAGMFENE